ncbi:MAG: glycosyltransferase family 4 protein [Anaerolineae bacterium]|nr:glycosyltransferase family 4 protein [Anaerolineae bacterium]
MLKGDQLNGHRTRGNSRPRQIAFIGNYLPRQCGIATFTTDLCQAVATKYSETTCFAIAVNDTPSGYDYPAQVRFELTEQDLASYQRAAAFLNVNNVDLVCLQHEYGIFGGPAGSHILALLRELRMPIVTTLHTVLREPEANQRRVMEELTNLSDRLVVMSRQAVEFLQDIYQVSPEKIDLIPHGIPDVAFVDPNFYKDQFGVEGKQVLLTFGLLSANKGIENVINALPTILNHHPNVVYLILGATHPHVKRHEGEMYRLSLQRLAREKGVEESVIFHNRFVSLQELVEFIGAADIYLTPYLNPAQIVSGTLAYTLGAGKAVVSTPYWYAEELLAEGRGRLVPFGDPQAIARQVIDLLDNETERHAMRKRAYTFGREMIWPNVAHCYIESFERARQERRLHPRPAFVVGRLAESQDDLPALKLDHLLRLTDDTGLLQHAIFTVPNYNEGYTTDDNARALVLTVLMEEKEGEMPVEVDRLACRYLAFLWHAFDPQTGRFRNFMAYDRRWLEEVGSEDSHSRALWALGTVLGRSNNDGMRGLAGRLFDKALPSVMEFTSPRAWAFALLAVHEYLRRFSGDRAARHIQEGLAARLLDLYRRHSTADWPWFEGIVSYDNASLPYALLLGGQELGQPEMIDTGLNSLRWLADIQCAQRGHFIPIGNQGFYRRGETKARFDQQPIEAQAMVSACLEAYRLTDDPRWYQEAQRAFEWFLGRNDLGLPLYDSVTGGCRDGLHPDRVNQNQGAESTLAFLLALVQMHLAKQVLSLVRDKAVVEPHLPQLV